MSETVMLPLTAIGLALVTLFASPAVVSILAQIRSRTPKDNFYEDRDGKATPESVAAFSNRGPKAVIVFVSSLGAGASLATSVLSTIHDTEHGPFLQNWLTTAAWVSHYWLLPTNHWQ